MHARHRQNAIRGDDELLGRFGHLRDPALQIEQARDQLQAVHGAVIDFARQNFRPRGGGAGGQAQFHPVDDQLGQRLEMVKLPLIDRARLVVDHAERAQIVAVVRGQWGAGKEAGAEFTPDHRFHGGEGCTRAPTDFRLVEAMMRLEPQAAAFEEADEGFPCQAGWVP